MLSDPWFMLLVGFVGGWLVEWVIDKVYFRPRILKSLEGKGTRVETEGLSVRVVEQQQWIADLTQDSDSERAQFEARIAELEAELKMSLAINSDNFRFDQAELPFEGDLEERAESRKKVYVKALRPDQLSRIKGIGPKYEELLWDAGILTFAQLANQDPVRLEEITQPEAWKKVSFDDWITEAKRIAKSQKK